jgi:hypothetical protein
MGITYGALPPSTPLRHPIKSATGKARFKETLIQCFLMGFSLKNDFCVFQGVELIYLLTLYKSQVILSPSFCPV